jgi:hypothetical protein
MSDYDVKPTPLELEKFAGAKIVRVEATVVFEAYALTDIADFNGKSIEERVAEEIADAIGYRAVSALDTEPGDALIAMTSHPDFAADVRAAVTTLPREAEMDHVVEMARGTSGER